MSANGGSFVEWEEQFVSQERGNRVVHYFLKNSTGDSFLAVVGTERSLRHMVYVVSDEFLQVYGSEKSNIACFKWRSKREVVDWLTSLLSKQHCTRDHSKLATNDSSQNSGAYHPATGFDERGSHPTNRAAVFARNLKVQNWDIVWSGTAWTCGKQLKHYQAFCRNGTTIPIHSFVLVMAKEENHYLAYLEDMYEDKKGQKKVKVRWFHQNQEVIGIIPPPTPHPREVFITPYSQVISAECVDGLASVLTPDHYEKCLEVLPNASPASIHFCFRQYRNNIVKPFNLSKLRGYFDQAVLSCLDLHVLSKSASHGSDGEEGEELSHVGTTRQGARKSRSCKVRPKFTMAHLGVRFSGHGSQITASGPAYQNLRFGLPGRRPLAVKYVGSQRWLTPPFKVGDKIELLCQDSGIRGCWFRCVVLEISRKQLKVRYDDVKNEDGCGNLEEWIPAFRSAAPDKLGMRSLGRLTIRPCPPHEKLNDGVVEIGTPVDAWWNDGWWEGVLAGLDSGGDVLQVYFSGTWIVSSRTLDTLLLAPVKKRHLRILGMGLTVKIAKLHFVLPKDMMGPTRLAGWITLVVRVGFRGEEFFATVQRRNLRISRDWIGNQWTDIEVKRDILSSISAVSPGTKVSASSIMTKGAESGGSAMSERGFPMNSGHDSVKRDKQALAGSARTDGLPEGANRVNLRKRMRNGAEVGRDDDSPNDGNGDDDDGQDDNDNGIREHGKAVMEVEEVSADQTCEGVPT